MVDFRKSAKEIEADLRSELEYISPEDTETRKLKITTAITKIEQKIVECFCADEGDEDVCFTCKGRRTVINKLKKML